MSDPTEIQAPTRAQRQPRPTATRASFSDELRSAVRGDGRTQADIAKAAGVDAGALSRFMRGDRGLTTDSIDRLAAAMALHLTAPARRPGRPISVRPPAR